MPVPVSIGDVVADKYLVERLLGKGGMGLVYVAKHLQLGERVAIKLLNPRTLESAELVARFLREGRTAARLQSEYVARVRDVGTLPDGAPFLVMEYLDGRDFEAVLAEQGTLDPVVAVKYLLQACEALAEAHSMGIVHRDLKPANLILVRKRDGTTALKIIDFGISKLLSGEASPAMTQPAVMLGSPLYMAPEQMASARDVDARVDVFSLGAILYHLLTGEPPFRGASAVEVFQHIAEGPPSPRRLRPDLPAGIEDVTARCLRKDRALRFPDVAALAAALAPFGPPHAQLFAQSAERILRASASTSEEASLVTPPANGSPRASSRPPPAMNGVGRGSPRAQDAPELLDVLFAMESERLLRADERPSQSAGALSGPPQEGARESAPPPRGSPLAPTGREAAEAMTGAVGEALSGFGLAGRVLLEGRQLVFHGHGPPTSIDAGPAADQWPLLPPDMQRRKAMDLARRLADAHRTSQERARSGRGSQASTSIPWGVVARILGVLVLVALVVGGVRWFVASRAALPEAPSVLVETPEQQRNRLDTACRAVRERIYSGATIGPYDTSGWLVELWLASRPAPLPGASAGVAAGKPISAASLASALTDGRLAPDLDPVLGQVKGGTLSVEDGGVPATSPGFTGVTLRFGGGYSRAFFEPESRTRFLAIADRLIESTGADLGALYARCAGSAVHDVGAWFRGRDAADSAAALLWGVGMFAERAQIERDALGASELEGLLAAAVKARLDAPTLKGLISEQGGSLASTPGAVTLVFPVGGPVRAVRASLAVAGKLGIARK